MTKSLFNQAAAVAVTNTVTASPISTPQGVGTLVLNAGALSPGVTLRIRATGIISAVTAPTGQLQIRAVSPSATVVLLDTTAVAMPTVTNAPWAFEGLITCYSQGAAGTVQAQGVFAIAGQASFGLANIAAVAIDTTKSEVLGVVWTWGTAAAGNSITMTNLLVELVN